MSGAAASRKLARRQRSFVEPTAMPPVRSKPMPRPAARSNERGLPPIRIRYYRQMKRNRVYNFVVSWDAEFAYRGPEQNVAVRLLAGGAQVVPAEVRLDPKDAKDEAFFQVTP